MAIREYEFEVYSDGIFPYTEVRVGTQGENSASRLKFSIDNTFYTQLSSGLKTGEVLLYRFDCYDGAGEMIGLDPQPLTSNTVYLNLSEGITRNGGKLAIYFTVTKLTADYKTEYELISAPARLRIENMPFRRADENAESLSVITQEAKDAAKKASDECAAAKQIAQSVRDDADSGLFKGEKGDKGDKGDTGAKGDKGDKGEKGDTPPTDQTYSAVSENAQSGKAVAQALSEAKSYTDTKIGSVDTVLDSIIALQNSYIGGESV